MEYKVLSQRGADPAKLEHELNGYAAEGWRVVSSFTVSSAWTLSTSHIMVLLERETSATGESLRPA